MIRSFFLLVLILVTTLGVFFTPLFHVAALSSSPLDDFVLTSLDSNFNVMAQTTTLCNVGDVNCVVGTYTCDGTDHALFSDCSLYFQSDLSTCVGECWTLSSQKILNNVVGPTADQIWFMDYAQDIDFQVKSSTGTVYFSDLSSIAVYIYALDANGAKVGNAFPPVFEQQSPDTYTFTSPKKDFIASNPSQDGKYGLYFQLGGEIFNTNFKVMFGPRLLVERPEPSLNSFELSWDCPACSRPEFSDVFLQLILSEDSTNNSFNLPVTIPDVVTLNPPDASLIPITKLTNVYYFPVTTPKIQIDLSFYKLSNKQLVFSLKPVKSNINPGSVFFLKPTAPILTSTGGNIFIPTQSPNCLNGGVYNSYIGKCVCPADFVGNGCQLQQATVCLLNCPTHMVPDSDCAQCICTTRQCSIHTRSFLIKLQNIPQEIQTNFGPTGVLSHFLPQNLAAILGINHLTPRTTGFASFVDITSLPSIFDDIYAGFNDDFSPPVGLEEVICSIPVANDNLSSNADIWLSLYPNYQGPVIVTLSTRPFVYDSSIQITEEQIQTRFTTLAKRLEHFYGQSNMFPNSQTDPSSSLLFPPPTPLNQPFIAGRCTLPSPSPNLTTFECPKPTDITSPLWNCHSNPLSPIALNAKCTFLSSFPIPSTFISNCLGMYPYMLDTCANRPTLPSDLATFVFTQVGLMTSTEISYSISDSLPISGVWTLNKAIPAANQYAMSIGIYVTVDGYMTDVLVKTVQAASTAALALQDVRFIIPTNNFPSGPKRLTFFMAILENGQIRKSSPTTFIYRSGVNPFGVQCTLSPAVIDSSPVQLSVVDPITNQCGCNSGYIHEYWFDPKNAIPITNDVSTFDPLVTPLTTQYDPTLYKCVYPCYPTRSEGYFPTSSLPCKCKNAFFGKMCGSTWEFKWSLISYTNVRPLVSGTACPKTNCGACSSNADVRCVGTELGSNNIINYGLPDSLCNDSGIKPTYKDNTCQWSLSSSEYVAPTQSPISCPNQSECGSCNASEEVTCFFNESATTPEFCSTAGDKPSYTTECDYQWSTTISGSVSTLVPGTSCPTNDNCGVCPANADVKCVATTQGTFMIVTNFPPEATCSGTQPTYADNVCKINNEEENHATSQFFLFILFITIFVCVAGF